MDANFAQPLTGYTPKKFSWIAIMEDGDLIGGFANTLAGCEKAAAPYEPLQYFVAGPTPMDWPKYSIPAVDPNQLMFR